MKKVAPKHTNFYKPKTVFLMLFALVCISCATKTSLVQNAEVPESDPKLIFLNYRVSQNSKGQKSIEFIDKKIVNGKLRNSDSKYIKSGVPGDLVCTQLSENKTLITEQTISNPLLKTIEFTTDSFNFKKRNVSIKQAPLNLRIQLNTSTKFIRIKEVIDSLQNTKTLITSNIE